MLGGGRRQLAHAQIIDDEQGYGGQSVHVFSTGAVDGGFGNIVEQGVGFTIEDAMALQDGRHADGLGQMTLAGSGWTQKQRVFVSGDEGGGGEIEDEAAIHLLVEGEVEALKCLLRVPELGLFPPPF